MPVNSLQKNRIVRRNQIQILTGRQTISPQSMIPTAPQNPRAFRQFFDLRRDSALCFVQSLRTDEINAQKRETDTGKMNMRVIKSGCHEFAFEVNFPRRFIFRLQIFRCANRDDFFAVNRHGFGKRTIFISRKNLAVV